jgi:uncharacterized protein (TIGR03437 family)
VAFSIDAGSAAALSPGAYYGTIRVSSSGIANSPQDFEVVLNVPAAGTTVLPDPQPAGLLFIGGAGAAVPPQSVSIYAGSAAPVPWQASAITQDAGGKWLTVNPATGTTSAASAAKTSVSVNPSGLAAGVYRGTVSFAYSGSAVRTVNVTLIVPGAASASPAGLSALYPFATAGCSPAQLILAPTGLVNNFAAPAAWPTPISLVLVDNCGNVVSNGQVTATFTNGDPPLLLPLADPVQGTYSGTWVPRGAGSQVTINATATAPNLKAATVQVASGQVKPNPTPLLVPNATTNIFNPQIGGALAPGTVVQLYGSNLAAQTSQPASLPLPTTVGSTTVLIGGIAAPLFYVAPGQINAQVPFELAPNGQYQIIVNANGALAAPQSIQLASVAPGVLSFASGESVAQRPDGSFVSDSAPAKPGDYLVLYLLGMGLTDNSAVVTGAASPYPAKVSVTLTLDGAPVPNVTYAGLTPSLVGLYQINFQVPGSARDGDLALAVSQGGTVANTSLLPVSH